MTRDLFTRIAGVYDRMNHVLSLGLDKSWRRRAVKLTTTYLSSSQTPHPPKTSQTSQIRILDLACGTGDLAFALARRFPRAEILGLDLTPAMLELARRKNRSARIAFAEANAEKLLSSPLDLRPGTFDLVSCAFGFRNFTDREAALRQIRPLMAPGGELLVLEFFRPRHRLLDRFTAAWLAVLARCFVPSKAAAYAYLRESMRATVSEDEFVALAAACGLKLVSRRFMFPCCSSLLFRR